MTSELYDTHARTSNPGHCRLKSSVDVGRWRARELFSKFKTRRCCVSRNVDWYVETFKTCQNILHAGKWYTIRSIKTAGLVNFWRYCCMCLCGTTSADQHDVVNDACVDKYKQQHF